MMNNMNQFGNNLNAPYGQNDYSQFFYGKNQYGQQQQNMNNLLWVQGIEGAKALMLPPNAKIICLDSEIENRAYIKIADEIHGHLEVQDSKLDEILKRLKELDK